MALHIISIHILQLATLFLINFLQIFCVDSEIYLAEVFQLYLIRFLDDLYLACQCTAVYINELSYV